MLCRVALRTQIVKLRINSEVQIKVLIGPMNNPLGVSPSKENQVTTRGKEKTFDLRIRCTVTLPTELRGRTEKVGDDLGGESRRRESKGTYECCAA